MSEQKNESVPLEKNGFEVNHRVLRNRVIEANNNCNNERFSKSKKNSPTFKMNKKNCHKNCGRSVKKKKVNPCKKKLKKPAADECDDDESKENIDSSDSDSEDILPFLVNLNNYVRADDNNNSDTEGNLRQEEKNRAGLKKKETIEWSSNLLNYPMMNFPYRRGPRHDLPANSNELAYFNLFVPEDFFQSMTVETNKYASYYQGLHGTDSGCKETNTAEMKVFLAIRIYMGIVQLPTIEMYFRGDFVVCQPIRNVMTLGRYQKLNQYFHLNDEGQKESTSDALYKVRPALDLTKNFLQFYQPGRDVSVDEAMIRFKGRLYFKQYMPAKPTKWGIKVWVIAESRTGYVLQCDIYLGKKKGINHDHLLGEQVVLDMTEPFVGCYHHIYFDNFFTSVRLMEILLERNLYACGTVRPNRQDLPAAFKKPKDLKLERGESRILQHGRIVATVWHDKRDVLLLSTNVNPSEQ